ncbi:MAG: DNA/RNA non-specific endonuclease [Bacteroidales bacterium]|nr:DNA/RNA non-specific endonuclease [Bacteroidales bacterium]
MKNLILILALLPLTLFAQYQPEASGELIKHACYSLDYHEGAEQPSWVYYRLTKEMICGNISRTDNFREDPKVSTGSATLEDYKSSGYDRGHLAPAADFKHSKVAMSESFYMSNMSAQDPGFNRGKWKTLEAVVRQWAFEKGEIYVVTGGILSSDKGHIGTNSVLIPNFYYKVIYSPSDNKMIGFCMANEKLTGKVQDYVETVDAIEARTGVDFFYQLEDEIEEKLEADNDYSDWAFNEFKGTSKVTSEGTSAQCKGLTQSGSRCKRKTSTTNGYCHQHQGQAK